MQQLTTMQPSFHCKQTQDRERHQSDSLVGQRLVCQDAQPHVSSQCPPQPIQGSLAAAGNFDQLNDPSQKLLGTSPAGSRFPHARYAAQLWCTGKDSNLRTPLGGADLQSAGFNHSPTCAETAKLSLPTGSSFSRTALYGVCTHAEKTLQASQPKKKQESREHTRARKPLHVGKIPKWSAFGKPVAPLNCFRRPAGNSFLELAKGFEPLTL
jgi:hypothetical protein